MPQASQQARCAAHSGWQAGSFPGSSRTESVPTRRSLQGKHESKIFGAHRPRKGSAGTAPTSSGSASGSDSEAYLRSLRPQLTLSDVLVIDKNKYSPHFGHYVVKHNDIRLREANPSVYAPTGLGTELTYLETTDPKGDRDYDGRRVISIPKAPENRLRLPHTFASLNGDYVPGSKKKKHATYASKRRKQVLEFRGEGSPEISSIHDNMTTLGALENDGVVRSRHQTMMAAISATSQVNNNGNNLNMNILIEAMGDFGKRPSSATSALTHGSHYQSGYVEQLKADYAVGIVQDNDYNEGSQDYWCDDNVNSINGQQWHPSSQCGASMEDKGLITQTRDYDLTLSARYALVSQGQRSPSNYGGYYEGSFKDDSSSVRSGVSSWNPHYHHGYNMDPSAVRPTPARAHNNDLLNSEAVSIDRVQSRVVQALRWCNGKDRPNSTIVEKTASIRADDARMKKQVEHAFVIKAAYKDGNQSVEDSSYQLMNKPPLFTDNTVARPQSAPAATNLNHGKPNRNLFAIAAIGATGAHANGNDYRGVQSFSDGGAMASIPGLGDVHMVVDMATGTMIDVVTIESRNRPKSASNNSIPAAINIDKVRNHNGTNAYESCRTSGYNDPQTLQNALAKRLKEKVDDIKDVPLLRVPKASSGAFMKPISDSEACQERDALNDLYRSMRGRHWRCSDHWRSKREVSEWFGIVTNVAGFVCEIHLPSNGLNGRIPASICHFSRLEVLNLDNNEVHGELPLSHLSRLVNLECISLRNNAIRGTIPWICLSLLPNLREVWLSSNNLSGTLNDIALHLSDFKSLTHLCLSGNDLYGTIPREIKYLKRLQLLSLSHNRISGSIPEEIQECRGLTSISLHNNSLEGHVPTGIANLKHLVELSLFNNQLESTPRSIEEFRTSVQLLCGGVVDDSASIR